MFLWKIYKKIFMHGKIKYIGAAKNSLWFLSCGCFGQKIKQEAQ